MDLNWVSDSVADVELGNAGAEFQRPGCNDPGRGRGAAQRTGEVVTWVPSERLGSFAQPAPA